MTKGPWGAEPPKKSTSTRSLKRYYGGGLIVSALVTAGIFGAVIYAKMKVDEPDMAGRVSVSVYDDVVNLAKLCPVVRGPIRKAMADGFITQGEARTIRTSALAHQKAYTDAAARHDAAAAVGAPAIAVPTKCEAGSLLAPRSEN